MARTVEEKYRKLTEVEHILARPGRYVGSVTEHTIETYEMNPLENKFIPATVTYIPAILKIFDEIISNSVDHSKTPEGKDLDTIKVDISPLTGEITVEDNGGIPVTIHKEYEQYVPEMIFGELRAGSNFDDSIESTSTGQNGEGAFLTNVLSTKFEVWTADGKKSFYQKFTDNSKERTEPVVKRSTKRGTKISFTPDYDRFDTDLNQNLSQIVKRVYDIAGTCPELKVYLDGERIKANGFDKYINNYYLDNAIFTENDTWCVGLAPSDDGFKHITFVNSTATLQGGTHIDYILNQIVGQIRQHIKKKYKVDAKPADIKNQITLLVNCDIIRPRYDSQTKEHLITSVKDYGTSIDIPDAFIRKVLKSEVVEKVVEWAEAKLKQQELAEIRKKNKELNNTSALRKIIKFDDATSRKDRDQCVLMLTEGDSAAKSILSNRDPKTVGVYPLKGKLLNVKGLSPKKVLEVKEVADIITILGLKIGVKANPEDLRFGKVCVATDNDLDGFHIRGLVINLFHEYWPELLEQGFVSVLNTPIVRVTQGKKVKDFFSIGEFRKWDEENTKPYKSKYYKGLGTWSSKEFKQFVGNDKYMISLDYTKECDEYVSLAFDKKKANLRKEWIAA